MDACLLDCANFSPRDKIEVRKVIHSITIISSQTGNSVRLQTRIDLHQTGREFLNFYCDSEGYNPSQYEFYIKKDDKENGMYSFL